LIALSQEYKKLTCADTPVVDKIDYNLLLEYGIINPNMMRHGNFDLTPQAINARGARTAPYPFDVGVKSVVTTARRPFRKNFASFDQDMLRLRCTERCTSEFCENASTNLCNIDLVFYSGDNRRLGQGYVSNYTCGSNRRFSVSTDPSDNENPKLNFSFDTTRGLSMYGLTLYFDEIGHTFPTELRVTTALNGVRQGQITIADHTGFLLEIIPDEDDPTQSEIFKDFNQLTIEFLEMNRAHIRARMPKLLFGVMTEFDNETLKDTFVCEFDVDSRGCRLPIQKMNFTIHDPDHEFDIENPRGKYAHLTDMQPITAIMYAYDQNGQALAEDGIPVCDMVLSGNVESCRGTVSFNAISHLQSANGIIDLNRNTRYPNMCLHGLLSTDGMSLHEALDRVLRQMDLPVIDGGQNRWQLHSSLRKITIKIKDREDLEGKSLNECARMMAQAGRCVIFEDAAGIIHVRPRGRSHLEDATELVCLDSDYKRDPENQEESGRDLSTLASSEMPLIEALTRVFRQMNLPLHSGDVRWRFPQNPEYLAILTTTPVIMDLSGYNLKDAVKKLAAYVDFIVYEDGAGIIYVAPKGDRSENIIPRYPFDLMFDVPRLNKFPPLHKVYVGEENIYAQVNLDGETETIKSEIIDGLTTRNDAQELANNIASEMSLRNEYSTSVRGGIEIEPFDSISVETKFLRDKTIVQLKKENTELEQRAKNLDEDEAEVVCINRQIARNDAEIKRIENGQYAYVAKRALRFNGAVNSDIKFFMEPKKGDDE